MCYYLAKPAILTPHFPTAHFPTAAMIFWSVIGRIAGAVILIVWQYRQEKKEAPISSLKEATS